MKSDKQALLEIMPEEAKLSQQQIASDASKGHLHNLWDRYNEARGHNSCRQSCTEKLAERCVEVEEIAKVIFLHDKWFDGVENKETCWKLIIEAKRHSGDCTNEAHTCQMCLKEDYFKQARALHTDYILLKRGKK